VVLQRREYAEIRRRRLILALARDEHILVGQSDDIDLVVLVPPLSDLDDGILAVIADAWAENYEPLRIQVTDFNTVVGECYERITDPTSLLDALTRRRLIDRALRNVAERFVTWYGSDPFDIGG
jgi:hypothetical protein